MGFWSIVTNYPYSYKEMQEQRFQQIDIEGLRESIKSYNQIHDTVGGYIMWGGFLGGMVLLVYLFKRYSPRF